MLTGINGNHQNWARLDQLWADPRWQHEDGSLEPIDVSDLVALLPRGDCREVTWAVVGVQPLLLAHGHAGR